MQFIPRGARRGERGLKGDRGDRGPMGAGTTGPRGNGILSIVLLSTVGLVKTYRITYTNGDTFDYTVSDGAQGADGDRGSLWFSGAGPPVFIPGQQDGDLYLDTTDDDAYQMIAGVWTFVGDFTGTAGPVGPSGPAVPTHMIMTERFTVPTRRQMMQVDGRPIVMDEDTLIILEDESVLAMVG